MPERRGTTVFLAASLIAGWVTLGILLVAWVQATADYADRGGILVGPP